MIINIILILAVLILGFILWMKYENSALTTTNYTVCSERLPEEADGRNFVVVADLHDNQFGEKNEHLIQKIDELEPDFIIVAGDLFVAREYRFDLAYDFLQKISKKYPVYYAYGNHEQKVEQYESQLADGWSVKKTNDSDENEFRKIKTFKEYIRLVRQLGVHVIDNTAASYPVGNGKNLCIYGGTIDLDYFKRVHRPVMTCEYLNQCFESCPSKDFVILAAHNPMYFDSYAKWGADLVLSGHVHGGMVRIPFLGGAVSPQMEIFPKYDGGLYEKSVNGHQSTMVVSRGLGIHTLKIRVFNRPELVHIRLKKK